MLCLGNGVGGCVGAYEYSNVIVDSCTLIGNMAVYGGALFAQLYTNINVTNSDIQLNSGVYELNWLLLDRWPEC